MCGVRSPLRYGRNSSPSPPIATPAASAVSASYDAPGATTSRSHPSAAPADKTVPIRYHISGTAWQNVCKLISGATRGSRVGSSNVPDVPTLACITPSPIAPHPTAPAALSAPPPTTGVPAAIPSIAAPSAVAAPATCVDPATRGNTPASNPSASSAAPLQRRRRTSYSSVPAASDGSVA